MFFRYLLKIARHIRDLVDYLRAFQHDEHLDLKVTKVTEVQYIHAARKLHARVYLDRGFVESKDIINGTLGSHIDPYQPHSTYFIVTNKKTSELVATSRQIEAKRHKGHLSFAMMNHTTLFKSVKEIIAAHDPVDCVEISALAKKRGVSKLAPLLLYRLMWQHSLKSRHKLWLLAIDVRLYHRLKLLFGPALRKAGPVAFYLGSDVVPVILNVQTSVRALERCLKNSTFIQRRVRTRVIRFMIKGVEPNLLNPQEREALNRLKGGL